MEKKSFELLAPAGSYEGFQAALGAGADAVYAGGRLFGARAYAKNFDEEELLKAIDEAHIHGRRLYLTVNTLVKNRELEEQLYEYLLPFYEAGLDAVIVQDLGVFSFIRENFPGLSLHASTQMAVTGPAGMRFLEQQGASRVVTARELSLSELAQMHAASLIEIESFLHGAMCYSFSGLCLMSSLLGGRSGNRGRCAQPCRLPYQTALQNGDFGKEKERCPLSMKDMCAIDLLPQILEAGVYSLKLEGRMKQPAYTAGVTAIYRKYLDRLSRYGKEEYVVDEADHVLLRKLFSRGGSCTGYYRQHNGPDMIAFSNEKKTEEIPLETPLAKKKLKGVLTLSPNHPVSLVVQDGEHRVLTELGCVQEAKNAPVEELRIRRQLEKLGTTEYVWEDLKIQMDKDCFVPMKILNECRREAVGRLREVTLAPFRRDASKNTAGSSEDFQNRTGLPTAVYVSCETRDQILAALKFPEITGLYVDAAGMETCMEAGAGQAKELYLALPHIVREELPVLLLQKARDWMKKGMKGFLVRNLESYAQLAEAGFAKYCVLDHSMYTWNQAALTFWGRQGFLRNTAPLELNGKELSHRKNTESELLVYGCLPLMLSAQCVRKNRKACFYTTSEKTRQETVRLKDRYGTVFPVQCVCDPWKIKNTASEKNCYNIIYNSLPFGLLKDREQIKKLGMKSLRLAFTLETGKECEQLLGDFLRVFLREGEAGAYEFTRGHFKRGAE